MPRINFFLLLTILLSSYIQIAAHANFDQYFDFIFKNKSSKYTVIVKKGEQPGMQNNTYVAYHLSPGQKEVYYTGSSIRSRKSEWFISVTDGTKRLCSTRIVFLFTSESILVYDGGFWVPQWHWEVSRYFKPVQTKNVNFDPCKNITISPNSKITLGCRYHHYPIFITILPLQL